MVVSLWIVAFCSVKVDQTLNKDDVFSRNSTYEFMHDILSRVYPRATYSLSCYCILREDNWKVKHQA